MRTATQSPPSCRTLTLAAMQLVVGVTGLVQKMKCPYSPPYCCNLLISGHYRADLGFKRSLFEAFAAPFFRFVPFIWSRCNSPFERFWFDIPDT